MSTEVTRNDTRSSGRELKHRHVIRAWFAELNWWPRADFIGLAIQFGELYAFLQDDRNIVLTPHLDDSENFAASISLSHVSDVEVEDSGDLAVLIDGHVELHLTRNPNEPSAV
jgi:hypothetical protein